MIYERGRERVGVCGCVCVLGGLGVGLFFLDFRTLFWGIFCLSIYIYSYVMYHHFYPYMHVASMERRATKTVLLPLTHRSCIVKSSRREGTACVRACVLGDISSRQTVWRPAVCAFIGEHACSAWLPCASHKNTSRTARNGWGDNIASSMFFTGPVPLSVPVPVSYHGGGLPTVRARICLQRGWPITASFWRRERAGGGGKGRAAEPRCGVGCCYRRCCIALTR